MSSGAKSDGRSNREDVPLIMSPDTIFHPDTVAKITRNVTSLQCRRLVGREGSYHTVISP